MCNWDFCFKWRAKHITHTHTQQLAAFLERTVTNKSNNISNLIYSRKNEKDSDPGTEQQMYSVV